MENVNFRAVQIASGVVAAAALIFGLLPQDTELSDCGSILFKGDDVYVCNQIGAYSMAAGPLVVIILIAAAACIYATVALNNAGSDATD